MTELKMCSPELLARDLRGTVTIVTGANCGIGYETARQLARQGSEVVLACRDRESAITAARTMALRSVGGSVEVGHLDLSHLDSVRGFVEGFLASGRPLHLLINNAGVMNAPARRTSQGYDLQFGVNHLGHFLLTALLLERMKESGGARVINVSSCYHDVAQGREGDIDFEDLHFERRAYDGWRAYAQSKLANVLHAKALARRLEGTGVVAVSLHPGWVRTRLIRHTLPVWVQNTLMRPVGRVIGMVEPWVGAQTTLHTALSPDVPQHSGAFYSQLGQYRAPVGRTSGWPMRSPNPNAHDIEKGERLWNVSAELVGL